MVAGRTGVVVWFALGALLASGCGYLVGAPYSTAIRTVEVPIFKSDGFRRGIEFHLTEAVQQQIRGRTPYRLAKGVEADTRLSGRIVSYGKKVIGLSPTDEGRELQFGLAVEVTWEDLRSGRVLAQQRIPVTPDAVALVADAEFAPEVGHSQATAEKQVVDRLAQQIVDLMEVPW